MTVLVTGGAGYIGSHMAKLLRNLDIEHVVLDNFSTGFKSAIQDSEYVAGSIGDEALLDQIFSRKKISTVIHFASKISVAESVTDPSSYYVNNVANTLVLLNKMAAYNVKNIVFSSTAAIFGNPNVTKIDEGCAVSPINPYGKTKAIIEQALNDFDAAYGIKHICLRYFNAAGADPSGTLGERHDPETHLIPLVLQAASGRREKISINGSDYPTFDGTCIRDYVHVEDLCHAHLLAIKYLSNGGLSKKYNLGNGAGYSVLQIIKAAEKITGKKIKTELAPKRSGDPAALVASSERIKSQLNWLPKYSDIDQIITHAWQWEQQWPWN